MGFHHISHDPAVMGGKPCIYGLLITVGTTVGLIASGSRERVVQAYPLLEPADINEAPDLRRLAHGRARSGAGPELMTRILVVINLSTE